MKYVKLSSFISSFWQAEREWCGNDIREKVRTLLRRKKMLDKLQINRK